MVLLTTPKKIIVRMPNWVGDLVMATPVLAELRSHWPHAHITAMCQSNVAPVILLDPNIDEVFSYRRPSGWIHRREHWDILESIRHGEYDLGVLLTNSFSSAWWFWRGNVRFRIGYAAYMRSFLLNVALSFPADKESRHLVLTYKRMLEPLGIPLSDRAPELYISKDEEDAAHQLLRKYGVFPGEDTIIGINTGAAYGSAKCWLPERFIELTHKLLEDPKNRVVFFGDTAGMPLVNDICKKVPSSVVNLAGKTTLRELLALIKISTVFLTNDSGPMHIAAALKTPLLALFGSTSDTKTGPYRTGTVIHKHVECSPCYKRTCPIDFRCMTSIEVNEVYKKLKILINQQR